MWLLSHMMWNSTVSLIFQEMKKVNPFLFFSFFLKYSCEKFSICNVTAMPLSMFVGVVAIKKRLLLPTTKSFFILLPYFFSFLLWNSHLPSYLPDFIFKPLWSHKLSKPLLIYWRFLFHQILVHNTYHCLQIAGRGQEVWAGALFITSCLCCWLQEVATFSHFNPTVFFVLFFLSLEGEMPE